MKKLLFIILLCSAATAAGPIIDSYRFAAVGGSTLLSGLVCYWKLNEASGTRADSVGGQTLSDPTSVVSGTGKIGNGADFEYSSTQRLTHTDNPLLSFANVDFTIAGWFSLESYTGLNGGLVVKGGGGGNYDNSNEYQLMFDGSGFDRLTWNVSSGSANTTVQASTFGSPPKTGTLFFIVAWHDADATTPTINIQVNNGAVDSAAHTGGCNDGAGDFHLGARVANPGFCHDGIIDEVGIWSRVLTVGERTALYNGGTGVTHPF